MKKIPCLISFLLFVSLAFSAKQAQARGWSDVQFVVENGLTLLPLARATVTIQDLSGKHAPVTLMTGLNSSAPTIAFNVKTWKMADATPGVIPTMIGIPAGSSLILKSKTAPPVEDIYIKITATRLQIHPSVTSSGTHISHQQITTFVNQASGNIESITQGQPGVASDSNGQQHIRGEHAEITYVVDGVPMPDTLMGRQGSIVVPSTIQSLQMITGGFAPEYGGQTAAIMDITTLPSVKKFEEDFSLQDGGYQTTNGDLTLLGPLGKKASYVMDINATRTDNAEMPQQPNDQSAHNLGSDQNYFTKFRLLPSSRDNLTLTLSSSPGTMQINNSTGLPSSFSAYGEGYGFLGMRNADGTIPTLTPQTANLLGAAPEVLPSQQAAGQDITQREVSQFATLSWKSRMSRQDTGLLSITLLHSGQDVFNNNPAVNVLNLPVDSSIAYNPTVHRNVHQTQVTGSVTMKSGTHTVMAGILMDDQYGDESYQLIPASQLALDELVAVSPNMAPAGSVQKNAQGQAVMDVYGNPVYIASSGTTPNLLVHRSGFYRAAYVQDTWKATKPFTINYGLRYDWFKQSQNLGQPTVDTAELSPRLNFSYALDRLSVLRWSYDRLFNTPPQAQGSVVGAPIDPETLNQYDVSYARQIGQGQSVKLAYYYKQIHNQVDTGLLIPGVENGIFSAVNFQYGAVHGLEFSYDLSPPKGVGWDGYFNYTYSTAMPNGLDNTGALAPDFNDHDQRNTIGFGMAYLTKGGGKAAMVLNYGSGLASSQLPNGPRVGHAQVDLHFATPKSMLGDNLSLGLDIQNVFDDRSIVNFQSGFSGTRFVQGRNILLSLNGNF